MTNLVATILAGEAAENGDGESLFELHPTPSLLYTRSGVMTLSVHPAAGCTVPR